MTDQELEKRLAQAVSHAAPDDLEDVLSRLEARKGTVIPLTAEKTTKKRTGRALRGALAACLALALVGGGGGLYYHQAHAVASVVSLDVNPSMELKVNRDEKVLSCAALNEDAAAVLFDMGGGADLVGTKLDVAVNAIVGALVRAGYLDSISSAILISVEDQDQTRAQRLQAELAATVDQALGTRNANTEILSQVLPYNAPAEVPGRGLQAGRTTVSRGKLSLVSRVMEMNGSLYLDSDAALEQLCELSVEELSGLLEHELMEIPIGKSAACRAAQAYAGTLVLSSVVAEETDVDPEFGDPRPHYEVELHVGGREYEYLVDAFTGEVYSGIPVFSTGPVTEEEIGVIGGADGPTAIITAPAQPETPREEQPAQQGVSSVTQAQAKAAAFAHAGCTRGNVSYCTAELEDDDGVPACWEVEFCWQGWQYEYEISCRDGSVLEWEREVCDDHPLCMGQGIHRGEGQHHGWSN